MAIVRCHDVTGGAWVSGMKCTSFGALLERYQSFDG